MRLEIEKRLHRVKIALEHKEITCPLSKNCNQAENCKRCDDFNKKCRIYINNSNKLLNKEQGILGVKNYELRFRRQSCVNFSFK